MSLHVGLFIYEMVHMWYGFGKWQDVVNVYVDLVVFTRIAGTS